MAWRVARARIEVYDGATKKTVEAYAYEGAFDDEYEDEHTVGFAGLRRVRREKCGPGQDACVEAIEIIEKGAVA